MTSLSRFMSDLAVAEEFAQGLCFSQAELDVLRRTIRQQKRSKKDANAPKGACNAYLFFSMDERQRLREEGVPVKDTLRQSAERWCAMTDVEKAPYNDLAARDKARYDSEMALYNGGSRREVQPKQKAIQKSVPQNLKPVLQAEGAAKRLESAGDDDSFCVVCMTEQKTHVLVPCGHKCVCENCSEPLKNKCPICRGEFTLAMKVFE